MTDVNTILADLRAAIDAQRYPEIMTPQQAAGFLGVSQDFLREHRQRRAGPAYSQPASKVIRYRRDDLIAWLNRSRIPA